MDDMDMAMALVAGLEDLDQVMLAMSPGSSATSTAPAAAAAPAAAGGGSSKDDEAAAAAADLRRGSWTVDEDILLVNYIAAHGEGRWNSLARSAGGIYTYIYVAQIINYMMLIEAASLV